MKKLIFIFCFIFAIQSAFALRIYNPEYGRWLNRDPIGVEGGINIYNSVSNNMINGFSGGGSWSNGMALDSAELIMSSDLDAWGEVVQTDCPIDEWLKKYSHEEIKFKRTVKNNKYFYTASVVKTSTINEILSAMMAENYVFKIKGGAKVKDVTSNLIAHIKARYKIVNNTYFKRYKFGAGKDYEEYHTIKPKPDENKDPQRYLDSINNSRTRIACLAATGYCFYGGIGNKNDSASRVVEVWIPGDWGYIYNDAHDHWTKVENGWKDGLEGENLIYRGRKLFWGHITDRQTVMSLKKWMNFIKKWKNRTKTQNGKPRLDLEVDFPTIGLEK